MRPVAAAVISAPAGAPPRRSRPSLRRRRRVCRRSARCAGTCRRGVATRLGAGTAEHVARGDEREVRVLGEEEVDAHLALAREERARREDEAAVRSDERAGGLQQRRLRRDEAREVLRAQPPARLGVAADGAEARARARRRGRARRPPRARDGRRFVAAGRPRSPARCSRPRAAPGGAARRASSADASSATSLPLPPRSAARASVLPPAPAHASTTNDRGGGATSSATSCDASSCISMSPRAKACVRNGERRPSTTMPFARDARSAATLDPSCSSASRHASRVVFSVFTRATRGARLVHPRERRLGAASPSSPRTSSTSQSGIE